MGGLPPTQESAARPPHRRAAYGPCLPEGAEPSLTSPNLALRPAADGPLALGPVLYHGDEHPQQGALTSPVWSAMLGAKYQGREARGASRSAVCSTL